MADEPVACGLGVGHRLDRRERLRRDDEQRACRVEIAGRLPDIGAVDVGHESHVEAAVAVVAQRLVTHRRAEVAAADADVDDARDGLPGVALPLTGAYALCELAHLVEHRMHAGYDIDAVDDDVLGARRAQRDVQHGALFGHVDLVAAEHRLDALGQTRPMRERDQQRHRLGGDAVLRIVEAQIRRSRR